jgi:hypothetical protein
LQPRVEIIGVETNGPTEDIPIEQTGPAGTDEPAVQVASRGGADAPALSGSYMFVQASEIEGEDEAAQGVPVTTIETVEVTNNGVVIETVDIIAEPEVTTTYKFHANVLIKPAGWCY